MDLRRFRFFITIVDAGSLARAAERLYISQTSLSEHVKALEDVAQVKLLVRHARGVHVTSAGKRFYEQAVAMLRSYQAMLDDARSSEGEMVGNVSVGIPNTISEIVSTSLLVKTLSQYPKIRLRISQTVSGDIQRSIREGTLDIGILYLRDSPPPRRMVIHHLLDEQMFIVAHRETTETNNVACLADFRNQFLFCPGPEQGLTKLIESYANAQRVRLQIAAEVDSLPAMIGAADAKMGYAILPGSVATLVVSHPNLVLKPLSPTLQRPVSVCLPEADYKSPVVSAMRRSLIEVIRNAVQSGEWVGAKLVKS